MIEPLDPDEADRLAVEEVRAHRLERRARAAAPGRRFLDAEGSLAAEIEIGDAFEFSVDELREIHDEALDPLR